jgi:D-alanine--D-alanine ligase
MAKPRLLLVFGGRSSEHEISIRSATEVRGAIDPERWDPVLMGIRRDGTWWTGPADAALEDVLSGGTAVRDLLSLRPDIVLPILHGPYGEDGTFQGLLEVLGVPYGGSGVLASALCMDKAAQKHLVAAAAPGIPLVPWVQVDGRDPEAGAAAIDAKLSYPCFIKPANMGSSVGVIKVDGRDGLLAAINEAAQYDHKLVAEQGVDAREIEVAILGNGGAETFASEPGEIVLPQGVWYDYDTKYEADVARYDIPADLPDDVSERIRTLALEAFRITGCRGWARVDFFLDRGTNTPYLNEINTLPGCTSISMYPKMMAEAGVEYRAVINRWCELGLAHHAERAGLKSDR